MLHNAGYRIYATGGTHRFLNDNGIPAIHAHRPSQPDMQPQALQLLHDHEIDLVVNVPKNLTPVELSNGRKIRRAAIDLNIPCLPMPALPEHSSRHSPPSRNPTSRSAHGMNIDHLSIALHHIIK